MNAPKMEGSTANLLWHKKGVFISESYERFTETPIKLKTVWTEILFQTAMNT